MIWKMDAWLQRWSPPTCHTASRPTQYQCGLLIMQVWKSKHMCACVEMHRWTIYVRATLDKDPGIKMPQTNLKQIEPWIEPFLHILKKKVLKGLRSNSRVQYKKCVIDMWEDSVNFWFFLFTFFVHDFFKFSVFTFILCTWVERAENALFLTVTLQGSTKPAMLILKWIKKWKSCCASKDVLNP